MGPLFPRRFWSLSSSTGLQMETPPPLNEIQDEDLRRGGSVWLSQSLLVLTPTHFDYLIFFDKQFCFNKYVNKREERAVEIMHN